MKRYRGRRVALLLASALPLLADNDVVASRPLNETDSSDDALAARPDFDDDTLTSLPAVPWNWAGQDLNSSSSSSSSIFDVSNQSVIVIPFRPQSSFWKRQQRQRGNVSSAPSEIETDFEEEEPLNDENGATITIEDQEPQSDGEEDSSADNETETEAAAFEEEEETEGAPKAVEEEEKANVKVELAVDYASKSAGALVLEKSANFQGASNLLDKDQDRYAIVPCEEESKFVVVGLSEDILVKQVIVANYERFSSNFKEFNVMGSTTAGVWADLGTFEATEGNGRQTFDLARPAWARYLKFLFLSYYGDEHYCTISQLTIHGSTVQQGFQEHWEEEQEAELADAQAAPVTEDAPKNRTVEKSSSHDDGLSALSFENSLKLILSGVEEPDDVLASLAYDSASRRAMHKACMKTDILSPAPCLSFSSFQQEPAVATETALVASQDTVRVNLTADCPLDQEILARVRSAGIDVSEACKSQLQSSNQRRNVNATDDDATIIEPASGDGISPANATAPPDSQDGSSNPSEQNASSSASDSATLATQESVHAVTEVATEPDTAAQATAGNRKVDTLEQTTLSLAGLLKNRLPSAKCLEELDFATFRNKHLKTGQVGPPNEAASMQPIFKKLTDEIKALQANVAVHNQLATESIACYQNVLLELLMEQEAMRTEQEARVRKIERDLEGGIEWIIAAKRAVIFLRPYVMPVVREITETVLIRDFGVLISFIRLMFTSTFMYILLSSVTRLLSRIFVGPVEQERQEGSEGGKNHHHHHEKRIVGRSIGCCASSDASTDSFAMNGGKTAASSEGDSTAIPAIIKTPPQQEEPEDGGCWGS